MVIELNKIFFGAAVYCLLFSFKVQAQENYRSVPNILEEFDQGRLTVDEAYIQMNDIYNDGTIHKCTTLLHMFEHKYKEQVTPTLIQSTGIIRNKLVTETFTSASGKFVFSYETIGANAIPLADADANNIPDYVEEAGIAIDSTYNYLVNTLGYSDPIPDGATYDISFEDMGVYGYVETNGSAASGTVMAIENDFIGFPENDDPDGNQLGALRATVAHELKHAIQFKQNNFNGDSDRWAEMDATLIEEVVYDQVNDYYNYLGGFGDVFGNPGVTVIPGSYEDVTWALYFHEKFGADFWPSTWQRIENSVSDLPLLSAISEELALRGFNYTETLRELYIWHFTSGAYRNNNFGFDESIFYPTPNVQSNITLVDDQFSSTLNVGRFSAYMANVVPPMTQTGDATVLMEVDSVGLSLAVVALFNNGSVDFQTARQEGELMIVNNGWQWDQIERLGVIVFNERESRSGDFRIRMSDTYSTSILTDNTKPVSTELKQNYPNPFNPSTTIPVSISEFQRVKVDIYDITGRLVQSVFDGNLSSGNYALPVDMQRFASGVYLYRLQTNDNVQIKRMTLVK